MANRTFTQFQGTLEKGVVQLFAEISFGASGAPTIVRGKGFALVTKVSTGYYELSLQDTYQRVLGASVMFKGLNAPAAPEVEIRQDRSATDPDPSIRLHFRNAGTLTEPADGDVVLLTFTLSNSTAL